MNMFIVKRYQNNKIERAREKKRKFRVSKVDLFCRIIKKLFYYNLLFDVTNYSKTNKLNPFFQVQDLKHPF